MRGYPARHHRRRRSIPPGNAAAVVLISAEFLAEPQLYLGQALLAKGLRSGIRYMPPHVVMLTNYCGGVGKTTLSLTLARYFRADCGLSTAIVEVGVGASSLKARLGRRDLPVRFRHPIHPGPARWEKVDIFSLGWLGGGEPGTR